MNGTNTPGAGAEEAMDSHRGELSGDDKKKSGLKLPSAADRWRIQHAAQARWIFTALVCLWILFMGIFLPWYAPSRYISLGEDKYSLFRLWTGRLILAQAAAAVLTAACAGLEGKRHPLDGPGKWMLLYLLWLMLSCKMSPDPQGAFLGAAGWHMGLETMALMIGAFFFVSLGFPKNRSVQAILLGSCEASLSCVFLLGIGNRLGWDPLGFYRGIDPKAGIYFLSTLGQVSWYAAFLCVIVPAEMVGWWISRGRVRIFTGIALWISLVNLVMVNSDGVFPALGVMLVAAFLWCLDKENFLYCFWKTLVMAGSAFAAAGVLLMSRPDAYRVMDRVPKMMSVSFFPWILILVGWFGCVAPEKWNLFLKKHARCIRRAAVFLLLLGAVLFIGLIAAYTKGVEDGGSRIREQLTSWLLFNDNWGNNRGFIWRISGELWAQMPLGRKLLGVGPDSYGSYAYSIQRIAARIHRFWSPDVLVNAHNEFLNILICEGIPGLFLWIGTLTAACVEAVKAARRRPAAIAVLFCVIFYCVFNFFGYRQVLCTPYLLLIMGVGRAYGEQNV